MFLCRHLLEFQNEAWSSLDQLQDGCGAPPTFALAPLDFEYLALPQVYPFFRWRLYVALSFSFLLPEKIRLLRAEVLQKLWRYSLPKNTTEESWTVLAAREWRMLDDMTRQLLQPGLPLDLETDEQMWSFWGSLLFCGTVYTTIGKGTM